MSPQLQTILDSIQDTADLSESEKELLIKKVKEADKAQSLSKFKLERLEHDKHTLSVMLEESIEDLQKKSRAIEAQNRSLEIESSLEKVRDIAMGMRKRDDMLDICRTISQQLESLGIREIRNVQTAIFNQDKGTYVNYEYYRLHDKALVTEVDYTSDEISIEFAAQMIKGSEEVFIRHLEGQQVKDWLNFQKTTNVFIDTHLEKARSLTYHWFSLGPVAIGTSTYDPLNESEIELFKRFRNVFELAYRRYLDIEKAEAQAREAQIQLALERVRARTMAMQKSDELQDVVHTLFDKLNELNIDLNTVFIIIFTEGSKDTEWWLINNRNQEYPKVLVKYTDQQYFRTLLESKENGTGFFSVLYSFDEKNEMLTYLFEHTDFIHTPEEQKHRLLAMEAGAMSVAIAKNIAIHITRYSKKIFSDEENDILRRLTKVFDQAYTRFLDLQKAEAQAREAQIQLALERVRARTMAMQRSNELSDVAALLFKQVSDLGVKAWTTGFNVWSDDNNFYTDYITNPQGGFMQPYTIDAAKLPVGLELSNAKKRGQEYYVNYEEGESLAETYRQLSKFGEKQFTSILESGFEFPSHQYEHFVFGSKVSLMFITYESVPEETHDIFKRFGKVFEQTYTRFLDLQKAEAQAKESRIEASLERVRSRSMAMHKSDELKEAGELLWKELDKLNIQSLSSGYVLMDKNEKIGWIYAPNPATGIIAEPLGCLHTETKEMSEVLSSWKKQEPLSVIEMDEQQTIAHQTFIAERALNLDGTICRWITAEQLIALSPKRLFLHNFNFKEGYLMIVGGNRLNEEQIELMRRFTKVFQQTYTRFLDLQKAEAQAREAQIETALERVRSRSMGMQKSDELKEVIQVVYEQFIHLNIHIEHTGFIMDYKERNDMHIWLADKHEVPFQVTIPYFDCAHWNSFNEAKQKGQDFFANNLGFEEKNKFYQDLFKLIPGVPEETLEYYFSCPGLAISTVLMENVGLYIENFSGIPYSSEENKILMRFGKVFQQTYTRFLDLQRAEAQAKEAQIEAALERVRSRTLAMQRSDELAETVAVLFQQLIHLGIEPNRLFINIIKDETAEGEFWISDENGSKIAMAYSANMNTNPTFKKTYDGWKSQNRSLIIDMHGKELDEYFIFLSGLNVPFKEGLSQKRRLQYIAYFNKGFIGMASPDEQPVETMQLLERFAAVFNLTFTRFNDLKVAEAHALKAEQDLIEIKAARKYAEESLAELQATQKQLVQSEKMASLGELTAGIAHEIQNPLNFVNNFSEVSNELIEELKICLSGRQVKNARLIDAVGQEKLKMDDEEIKQLLHDITQNLDKISHHGKRADAIVKGMLQHSRASSSQKELTDINALADEYLRLAYHGLRAKDKSFNAKFITDFDNGIGKINIIPQDIGRVILNLINNAFYAVNERQKAEAVGYEPTVKISTASIQPPSIGRQRLADGEAGGRSVQIKVVDNGGGIPQQIVDKIFQPFFTTKPTGQGTGLGLSLTYDIVKAHGGEIKVETKEGEGSEFIIQIPTS